MSGRDELDLLLEFREAAETPPPGLQERLEEQLMQQVLAEEARIRRRDGGWLHRRGLWPTLVRQGALAVVSGLVVVALSFSGGTPSGEPSSAAPGATMANATGLLAAMPAIATRRDGAVPGDAARALTPQELNTYPVVPGYAGEPSLLSQGPSAMDEGQLDEVPTDPATLHQALARATAGQFPGHDSDFAVFRLAGAYLADPSLETPLRVAFLRTLASLQNAETGGAATDVLGREGVIIARLDSASGVKQLQLLDIDTAQTLQQLEYTTRVDPQGTCQPGIATAIVVYDANGFVVAPQDAPYARWPQVVSECG